MTEPIDDPFRPFLSDDDGRRLVLRHRRALSDWMIRICMYTLLLLVLVLFALIPWAAWERGRHIGDLLLALVMLVPTWLLFKVMVSALRADGVIRIVVQPGTIVRRSTGVLLGSRERIDGVTALAARTITQDTRYGPVRWLELRARTASGLADITNLHLDRNAEPAREAAARQAAATIAARLGVPLELDGQR